MIERKGFKSFILYGMKSRKAIPIRLITSIKFKAVGKVTNGYIQFGTLGSVESGGGILTTLSNENTIVVERKNYIWKIKYPKIQKHHKKKCA